MNDSVALGEGCAVLQAERLFPGESRIRVCCLGVDLLRLNDDVYRRVYRVWRVGGLAVAGRGDSKDAQLTSILADGIEMVRVVPEALLHIIRGEKSGICRDWRASVEVEDL
jgi:hypothetical protein